MEGPTVEVLVRAALSNAAMVAVLAVAVLAVDRLLRRPALSHRLWLLLLLKLVTPPLVGPPFDWPSPGPSRPSETAAAPSVRRGAGPAQGPAAPPARPATNPAPATTAAPGPAPPSRVPETSPAWRRPFWFDVPTVLAIAGAAWLSIAALRGAWLAIRLLGAGRRLRHAEPVPEWVQERAGELARRMGLRRAPGVWLVDETISPMIWSLGGPPRLLLPAALWRRLGTNKRDALLAHELAHLRRRDHWVRWLELIVAALYWWFPVAAWARRSMHEAEERCCDAWVVAVLPECRRLYAEALLDAVDFLSEGPAFRAVPLAASGMLSVVEIRDRLARIMAGEVPRRLTRAGAAGVAGFAVAVLPLNLDRSVIGPPRVPTRYAVRDLSAPGPIADLPLKLNDRGQVLGWYHNPKCPLETGMDDHFHSYLTRPDRPIDPETDDLNAIAGEHFRAIGVNNKGQVVGILDYRSVGASRRTHGVVLDGGRVLDIGTLPESHFLVGRHDHELPANVGGPIQVWATAINDRGQVAGDAFGPLDHEKRSFLTGPNQPIDAECLVLEPYDGTRDFGLLDYRRRATILGLTPFWHYPIGNLVPSVNNRGQVAGSYFDLAVDGNPLRRGSIGPRGFRTAPGRPIDRETDDLGLLRPERPESAWTWARDINIRGQVVGVSSTHAFRTAPNRPINRATDDLGPGEARAINDWGWAVGRWQVGNRPTGATLSDGARSYDLNGLIEPGMGWTLSDARDINNRGQIIAEAEHPDRGRRGVLLDPVPDYSPLSWLIAGTVLMGLAQAARRSKSGLPS
jgi:probable HAF family extracellular repeat protein